MPSRLNCASLASLLIASLSLSPVVRAEQATPPAVGDQPKPAPVKGADQAPESRPYDDPYKNGLYSTLVAMISVGANPSKLEKAYKIQIPKAKKAIEVRAILQEQPAPLVVVLVGIDGKATEPLGRWLPAILDRYARYNVLFFDSTFRPQYAEATRFGVCGNMPAEAAQVNDLITEFLKIPEVKKKVTKIGVVGYSMQGLQAMLLAKMAAEKKLTFELSGAIALSPPIKVRSTALVLDDMYARDRFKYTVVDMATTFMNHLPVARGAKIPFEPEFMRAGIGLIVRDEFTQIVERNDNVFRLKHIPDEEEAGVNRVSQAEAWGMTKFMEEMCFPYWKEKGAWKTVDEMWASCDLTEIMKTQPDFSRVIAAEDDPFDDPADFAALKAGVEAKHLVLLPFGGHLGFLGSAWNFHQVKNMFEYK